MKQKTALVLGGGGFIGGHLAKKLKEELINSGCEIKSLPTFLK
mgnify:CR=1 FL=1